MIRMAKIIRESKQEENYRKLDGKQKKLVLDAVNKFNQFEQHIYRQKDVREVVEAIKTISEYAGRLALDETEDWFDGVTVKKDVKEINNAVKLFEKAAGEVGILQHRLEALYEDIGGKLSRYYEIADIDKTVPLAPKNAKINESKINWSTLDKIIKTAKYDPAMGEKIRKWAATHPPHNPYIYKDYAEQKPPQNWKRPMKLLDDFIKTEDDIWPAHKQNYLDKHQFGANGKKLNKIILAYWFSTTKWRK